MIISLHTRRNIVALIWFVRKRTDFIYCNKLESLDWIDVKSRAIGVNIKSVINDSEGETKRWGASVSPALTNARGSLVFFHASCSLNASLFHRSCREKCETPIVFLSLIRFTSYYLPSVLMLLLAFFSWPRLPPSPYCFSVFLVGGLLVFLKSLSAVDRTSVRTARLHEWEEERGEKGQKLSRRLNSRGGSVYLLIRSRSPYLSLSLINEPRYLSRTLGPTSLFLSFCALTAGWSSTDIGGCASHTVALGTAICFSGTRHSGLHDLKTIGATSYINRQTSIYLVIKYYLLLTNYLYCNNIKYVLLIFFFHITLHLLA